MIDLVYYNPKLRVYRNGTVERWYSKMGWKLIDSKPDSNGYIKITVDYKQNYVHRLVMNCFKGLNEDEGWNAMIDHIDRNPANNHVDNLRIVNNQQNQWNNDAKGYYYDKRKKKYHATICLNDKPIFLGLFNTEEEAHQAYLTAKLKYHNLTIGFDPS